MSDVYVYKYKDKPWGRKFEHKQDYVDWLIEYGDLTKSTKFDDLTVDMIYLIITKNFGVSIPNPSNNITGDTLIQKKNIEAENTMVQVLDKINAKNISGAAIIKKDVKEICNLLWHIINLKYKKIKEKEALELSAQKENEEKERLELLQKEQELRIECERIEKEALELKRVQKENEEKENLERLQKEQEAIIEFERIEKERLQKEEQEKLEREIVQKETLKMKRLRNEQKQKSNLEAKERKKQVDNKKATQSKIKQDKVKNEKERLDNLEIERLEKIKKRKRNEGPQS